MIRHLKILFAAGISFAVVALPIWYSLEKPAFDRKLVCENEADGAIAIFLVDVSDPYDVTDAVRTRNELAGIVRTLPLGTTVVFLQPNANEPYAPRERLNECSKPAFEEWPQRWKMLFSTDMRREWNRKQADFGKRVSDAAGTLVSGATQPSSPLMETLIAISKRFDFRDAKEASIYIYSDMEQNTNALSVYRNAASSPPAAAIPLESISLRGARVSVKRIVRRTHLGIVEFEDVQKMWTSWFNKSNASVVWER